MFISNGTLKSEEKSQDARFGYALAAAPDLNHDGFTDLLVGAPLEDEHKGAIYVYHGDGIYINHNFKQVHGIFSSNHKLTEAFQNSIKLTSVFSLNLSAYSRVIDFPLPAVFWPQSQCSVGLGWR